MFHTQNNEYKTKNLKIKKKNKNIFYKINAFYDFIEFKLWISVQYIEELRWK